MTTLAEARSRVRLQLEDTSTESPLWSDEEIDEALRRELDNYSNWSLRHDRDEVVVESPSSSIPMPDGALRVLRVMRADSGWVIPRRTGPVRSTAQEEIAWEPLHDEIVFRADLPPATYEIRYVRAWVFPSSDSEDFGIPTHHVSVLLLGAALWCLERRGIEDWKRGPIQQRYTSILMRTRADYMSRWRSLRGSVRSAHMATNG